MKKVLMILTSHRLDCFSLAMDFLHHGGSLHRFDVVTILCSGVRGRHLRYINSLPRRFPDVNWDFIHGPRGRGKPISDLQNECVRRHPEALYFKLDEDTLVSSDWDLRMMSAYETFKDDDRLSLISAVVTNNQRGAYFLMNLFPELGEEFTRTFNKPIVNERMGPVWLYPQCAEFMIRRFLDLDRANVELRERLKMEVGDQRSGVRGRKSEVGSQKSEFGDRASESLLLTSDLRPPTSDRRPSTFNLQPLTYLTFSYPFSINCIAYDYRHWREIGGVPEFDENGWGEWIPKHDKFIVLVQDALVHHYSFFVQQDWLDRTSLLEDLRAANLPKCFRLPWTGKVHQASRVARQIPRAVARRLAPKK